MLSAYRQPRGPLLLPLVLIGGNDMLHVKLASASLQPDINKSNAEKATGLTQNSHPAASSYKQGLPSHAAISKTAKYP